MFAIGLRVGLVAVALAAITVLLWAPWRATDPNLVTAGTVFSADGEPMREVPGADRRANSANHMVRYQMPVAREVPDLPAGTEALIWEDLWVEGEIDFGQAHERVGTPGEEEFPEGSTAEDVMMFFLDIADLRSFQPEIGGVREELDGTRVRLAGYTTPVGFSEDETDFLLVPELGACIHVPPPPANQIVYVPDAPEARMFAPVWVTGTLRADPVATILANVAYRLEDVTVEPYL